MGLLDPAHARFTSNPRLPPEKRHESGCIQRGPAADLQEELHADPI